MKSNKELAIRNRHFVSQSFEEGTPHNSNCLYTANILTFSQSLSQQSRSQNCNSNKIKSKYWNQNEQRLFVKCWLQNFIQNPNQNFSLDAPLNRYSFNKAVSSFINRQGSKLNLQCSKTPDQCKTKFGTIRRKIYRLRQSQIVSLQFDFIDYIIQNAGQYVALDPEIEVKVKRVEELRMTKGPLIQVAFEQYGFMKTQAFGQTFDCLLDFIEKMRIKQN